MMTNLMIPPIVSDWLQKLNDEKQPLHVRDNYCMMIEHMANVCQKQVDMYRMASKQPPKRQRS